MLTELAPPPKKRVTIKVAKFGAVADGMSQIRNKIYAPKYPGMRPVFSVNGTKSSGKTAAPTFHDAVAQYSQGKFSWLMPNSASIWTLPEPYAPAGKPVKIELLGCQHVLHCGFGVVLT